MKNAVDGLVSGTVKPEETDALLRKLQKLDVREEDPAKAASEAQRKREEEAAKGRRGKGAGEGYHWFCKHCFLEFLPPEMAKCTQCQGVLMSREERRAELMEKVREMKERKDQRAARRERFEKYRAAQKDAQSEHKAKQAKAAKRAGTAAGSSLSHVYEAWDCWEPSSEEEAELITPENNLVIYLSENRRDGPGSGTNSSNERQLDAVLLPRPKAQQL